MIFHFSSSNVSVRIWRLARMGALPPALPAIRHSTSITSVAPMSCVNLCLRFKWVTRTSPRMDMRTESRCKSWLSLSTGSYLPEKWLCNNCIWSAWASSCNATTSHGWGTLANPTNENRQPKKQTNRKQHRNNKGQGGRQTSKNNNNRRDRQQREHPQQRPPNGAPAVRP